jgi:hypothetical protein
LIFVVHVPLPNLTETTLALVSLAVNQRLFVMHYPEALVEQLKHCSTFVRVDPPDLLPTPPLSYTAQASERRIAGHPLQRCAGEACHILYRGARLQPKLVLLAQLFDWSLSTREFQLPCLCVRVGPCSCHVVVCTFRITMFLYGSLGGTRLFLSPLPALYCLQPPGRAGDRLGWP